MKKSTKVELIVCIIALLLLAVTINSTFATNTVTDANEIKNLLSGGSTNKLSNENATNILEGENKNVNINNVNTNTNITNKNVNNTINNSTNNSTNNANELPNTGINNPSIVIVAICLISAIYAYKKIKDYNIK